MRIGAYVLDTEHMTREMVNAWVQELKKVRARKMKADHYITRFNELMRELREDGFDFCCRGTGEVLMPKYWVLMDNQEQCEHVSTLYEEDEDANEDDFDDPDLECGFDPYMGCYTDDC